ncbi:hypothetical protein [Neorhodopirellula pilleata]|uniref:Uncharacterized protein n=1 Tax=Neorhodopirellula pilleata TaxID=2714738 RepID=A0A5C5ZS14_9BACT|nr:hypothetical protein [Neorhodopirellula pilleata]TWT89581.1 hypothetical protein Pla100_55100 [Neorhodopirellula pilleata]
MRPNSLELSPLGHDELSRSTAAARTLYYNFQLFTGRSVIGGVPRLKNHRVASLLSPQMNLEFLRSRIVGREELIAEGYPHDPQDAAHARELCEHLQKIVDGIEWHRCEGRLMPAELYNNIDLLLVDLERGGSIKLDDLLACADELARHYQFSNDRVIDMASWWPENPLH